MRRCCGCETETEGRCRRCGRWACTDCTSDGGACPVCLGDGTGPAPELGNPGEVRILTMAAARPGVDVGGYYAEEHLPVAVFLEALFRQRPALAERVRDLATQGPKFRDLETRAAYAGLGVPWWGWAIWRPWKAGGLIFWPIREQVEQGLSVEWKGGPPADDLEGIVHRAYPEALKVTLVADYGGRRP